MVRGRNNLDEMNVMACTLAENFNLADNTATTLWCIVIAETSILQTFLGHFELKGHFGGKVAKCTIQYKTLQVAAILYKGQMFSYKQALIMPISNNGDLLQKSLSLSF